MSCRETTIETGIQYLRKLTMLEVVYNGQNDEQSPIDPDEVQSAPLMAEAVMKCTPICQFIDSRALGSQP